MIDDLSIDSSIVALVHRIIIEPIDHPGDPIRQWAMIHCSNDDPMRDEQMFKPLLKSSIIDPSMK
jgi:hypothetical protein